MHIHCAAGRAPAAGAGALATRGAAGVAMKVRFSLNAQTVPGEREDFEVCERRFERDVMSANLRQLLRRKVTFENKQDIKKRRKAEAIFRRSARGRKIPNPETWEDQFGDEMVGLGVGTDFEDLDFEFLTSVSNLSPSPFEEIFTDPQDLPAYDLADLDSAAVEPGSMA